ncbi:hypothetical protein [Kutzneria buriramensis]|uniref:Uncharacterized protein n=1 Tax=Kutzneria buriramensis TaxID=1045776 RepID=A0A3E0HD81_9PSEU|nr:hypothetical protein [Kutzneria buriramensis]REH42764.1 hypothetical protein BCF44_110263 [Kutzneria buriramensis]
MLHSDGGRRTPWLRRTSAVVGIAAVVAAGFAPTAQADPVTGADSTHIVTLVTGDRVVVQDVGGRQTATVMPRPGSTGDFVNQRVDGDLYVVPATALPYLGTSLDRSLFDVSALIRDGVTDQVPVQVAGSAPGVRDGKVTAESGTAFGAALAAQAGRDAKNHFVTRGPLFGTASSVRLAAAGAPQQVHPNFPMHTVRILTVNGANTPADASLGVMNTDDGREFNGFPYSNGGEARVSVPSGDYGIVAWFPTFDSAGRVTSVRVVVQDFVVSGDQAVTIDASKATSQVTVSTPRPSNLVSETLEYVRSAQNMGSQGYSFGVGNGTAYVAPSTPSTVGGFHFNVQTHSESPAGAPSPYSYDLKIDNAGALGSNQHYKVTSDQLATLKENYHSDKPGRLEGSSRIIFLPYEFIGFGQFTPLTAPLQRTEYVLGGPDLSYADALLAGMATGGGFIPDTFRQYAARTTTPVDWLRGPLAPGLTSPAQGVTSWFCSACRRDDTIRVVLTPVLDSDGHGLYLDPPTTGTVSTSHFQLLSDGKALIDGKDVTGGEVAVPADQADYKIVYDQTRTAAWFHQSTVSHSEWTFGSAHSGAQTVPTGWACDPTTGKATDCSALPLVTASYQLNAGLDGTAPAGPDQVVVTFGHAPGGPNLPFAKGAVQVSFDGGATWTPTFQADLGGGRYRAQWTNPASVTGGDVALRVSATDVAGNSLTQSVLGAFTVPAAQS